MLDSTNIARAPRVYRRRGEALRVCGVIRAKFEFQVHEIIVRTCYVNSGKTTEFHMTTGFKYKGTSGKNKPLMGVVK